MKIMNPLSTKREEEFFQAVLKNPLAPVNPSTIDKNIENLIKKKVAQGLVGVTLGLALRFALKYRWPQHF